MSYTPTVWASGDIVTSTKLNKLENGVASAGGGGSVLIVNVDGNGTLDKTWQEIHDALEEGTYVVVVEKQSADSVIQYHLTTAIPKGFMYVVATTDSSNISFSCILPNLYPTYNDDTQPS